MNDPTVALKRCARCKKIYPATTEAFYRRKNTRCGLNSWCMRCCRASHAARKLTPESSLSLTVATIDKFWSQVNRNGPTAAHAQHLGQCWTWSGQRDRKGYGRMYVPGSRCKLTHRISWFIDHGSWPSLHCLHACDNPSCVRPDHLFEGTNHDNALDRHAKGRDPKTTGPGELSGACKLSDAEVMRIRELGNTCTRASLARTFGVSAQHIGGIITGKTRATSRG